MASIETRRNTAGDTVYRVRFRLDGKNRAETFTTLERAQEWRVWCEAVGPAAALAALETATGAPPVTVAEHVRRYINLRTGTTKGTTTRYTRILANDIEPYFRDLPLTALDREAVAKWVNKLADRGLSGKSIRNVHGVLSAALNMAVADKVIEGNPCLGMRLPQTVGTEKIFLEPDEFVVLLQAMTDYYKPLLWLLAGTGMRFGEATALQVGDVNLRDNTARIRHAWKPDGSGGVVLGVPKSKRSLRTIVMASQSAQAIAPLMKGRKATELILTNTRGDRIRQGTIWGAHWKPAADVVHDYCGKRPRIHDLRHSYVSWAISGGVPLPTIQRQLGHESITTTIDTYGHLARSDFDALASVTTAALPELKAHEPRAIGEDGAS